MPIADATRQKSADLERLKVRMDALLSEYKTGLPAEKKTEFANLMTRARTLKQEIEDEVKLADDQDALKDIDRFLNDPQRSLPHGGSNADDDSRKSLLSNGWEIKGGVIYAPHSQEGKTYVRADGSAGVMGKVPLFPEEVLFGDIPSDDSDAAEYFKQTRAAMQPTYAKTYAKYIRTAAKLRSESMALAMLSPSEQKALSEGSDPNGGFLVPPDAQAEMLARVGQQAVIRQSARVQTTSRDMLTWPMVKPHATSGSIYSSGFVGGWVGETPAFTDTDPGFQQFQVPIKKLRVATKLSNDLVSDAAVNIVSWLAQNGAENMALVEDNGFLNGDGTALQPLGILNSGIATIDVEGSTANTISNTTSSPGTAPKIITLTYALPAQYASRARWVMRRVNEGKIRALVDASGRFMWPAQTSGGFSAVTRELMGYPIDNSDFMPADGVDGAKVVLYGDLSAYIIGQRAQITSVVLRERFADTDQVGIILFERVGGAVWNPDAMRIGVV